MFIEYAYSRIKKKFRNSTPSVVYSRILTIFNEDRVSWQAMFQ